MQGTAPEDVYPNTIFLPGTGVQRGSTYIGDGDPLSPHWASVPNAYRYNLINLGILLMVISIIVIERHKYLVTEYNIESTRKKLMAYLRFRRNP